VEAALNVTWCLKRGCVQAAGTTTVMSRRTSTSTAREFYLSDDPNAPGNPPAGDPRAAVLAEFVAALPKAELHVHLLGSASLETVAGLARRHPGRGVPDRVELLSRFYEFSGFAHFIAVYTAVNRLVTDGSDVADLIAGLAGDLARNRVRYAEVTVTTLSHLKAGIDPLELAEALAYGRDLAAREHGVELAWIFDISSADGPEGGAATVDWMLAHQPPGTVGLGLGGPEAGYPRHLFRESFDRARAAGYHSIPHAGETTGPQDVWSALTDLKAERVGHGIGAVQDPRLLDHLAETAIPLEISLTSNLRTGAVGSAAAHPLPALLSSGVTVTLNTDDPGMFGTTLNEEYELAARRFGLPAGRLADLARAGVRAAFCGESLRRELLAEIDGLTSG
jgi:aminodeoxyfutalosine deaminase